MSDRIIEKSLNIKDTILKLSIRRSIPLAPKVDKQAGDSFSK